MENVASLHARAQSHINYSIERIFILAALVAIAFATYLSGSGSLVVRAQINVFIFPALYGTFTLILLLASVAVRMNESDSALKALSYIQIIFDLITIPLAALLMNDNSVLILLMVPVVGSASLFHTRAPIATSLVASLITIFIILGGGSVISGVLSSWSITTELISIPVRLSELLLILVFIMVGSLAAQYGRALRDHMLLLVSPRTPKNIPTPRHSDGARDESAERALQAKAYEVERANERLSGLDKAKSDFVSVATHQLRTPLAGIKWTFESLLQDNPNPNEKELLEKGFAATERMVRIVGEILSIDKIEHQRFEVSFEYVDPIKLLEGSVVEFQAPAIGKGVHLMLVKPEGSVPLVELDTDKTRMIIDNLIENAIKYTSVGGEIKVLLNTDKVNAAKPKIEIIVKDSGIGIDESAQHDIFTKFYRAQNAKRAEPNGSGLGLYIAKTIVEAHHGSIWFESEVGKGTEFHVELPVHQST